MAFEKFKGQGGKSSSPFPVVFIWKRGSAGFSFVEMYFEGKGK